jgi:hypothetical protein
VRAEPAVPPRLGKVMGSATEQPGRLGVAHLLRCGMPRKLAEDPMKSFERYRRYAADCLKMAQSAANDGDKARLLQMAETWRHLAELAEAQAAVKDDDC